MKSVAVTLSDFWVVLPGHNEEKRLKPVLEDVKKYCKNIIFVDDGSKDKTYDIACSVKGVTVLSHITNFGKGAALKTGCDFALQHGAKYIAVMDSDGQHEPVDLLKFEAELKKNKDIVFGCRPWDQTMPFVMKAGNFGLHMAIKLFFGFDILDTQSGFRAFTSEAYKKVRWESNDYSMESEMIVRASKHKLNYSKFSIRTIYHDDYKGTTVMVGLKIGLNILFWRIFGLANQQSDSENLSSSRDEN